MSYYSDPTANAAMGAVDREIRVTSKRAERIKERRRKGQLTDEELAWARKEFIGIFAPLLRKALED